MLNRKRIADLLDKRGLKNKQLLEYMGKNWNGSIEAVFKGDVRISKVERMADFFGLPIDYFFDRDVPVGTAPAKPATNTAASTLEKDVVYLASLIEEKDKRIAALEELLALYRPKN